MASATHLPSIHLELWSERRHYAVCCRATDRAGSTHAALRQTKENRGIKMKTSRYSRVLRAAFIGIAMAGLASVARADIKNYEFQLLDQAIKAGPDRIITVRLINKTTGKPVPDAVI